VALVEPGARRRRSGGQAFWSFGGLFLVDSPEQRRLRIKDSHELALQDWLGTAAFDRPEDEWPRRWAEAYVDFAAGEKRAWLKEQGVRPPPHGRLGRARRLRRHRARELGAAIPHRVGHRSRRGRAVR
jgi:predicted oxidoreductase